MARQNSQFSIATWEFPGGNDGRNATWVLDYSAVELSALFFTEHTTNSANIVLRICGEQIGNAPFFQEINSTAFALDVSFNAPETWSMN